MARDHYNLRVEWLARRLMLQQEDAAATELHRIMVSVFHVSRVPNHVREHNADAYTPGLVAIGPLHAANPRLHAGTRLKMAYLNSLISRGHPDPAHHLAVIEGYIRVVGEREREARAMYAAEDVDYIRTEDFVQMLVLDGCFIIEHLVNVATGAESSLHATTFGPVQLSVDLVLFENQIPFFVLVDLIKSTRVPEFDNTGYQPTELLTKLVLYYLGGAEGRDMSEGLPAANDVAHILHLLHAMVTAARTGWEQRPRLQDAAPVEMMQEAARTGWKQRPRLQDAAPVEMMQGAARLLRRLPLLLLVALLYPTLPEESRWSARYGRVGVASATDLKRMLMQLKKARGRYRIPAAAIASVLGPVPLAVKLVHKDRLFLPQLQIEFRTAPLLLNLMAFEQSADQRAGDVSAAYVWFMATMVRSPEDAGVLVASEVVQSSTGCESNEDVARFFKRVGAASEAGAEVERSYLGETVHMLRERSEHPLLTKRADVQRYYVNMPWRLVAAFVTVVTTVATILQTFASFKQKP